MAVSLGDEASSLEIVKCEEGEAMAIGKWCVYALLKALTWG